MTKVQVVRRVMVTVWEFTLLITPTTTTTRERERPKLGRKPIEFPWKLFPCYVSFSPYNLDGRVALVLSPSLFFWFVRIQMELCTSTQRKHIKLRTFTRPARLENVDIVFALCLHAGVSSLNECAHHRILPTDCPVCST